MQAGSQINKPKLEKDGSFAVKESAFINSIIAAVAFAVFFYALYLVIKAPEGQDLFLDGFMLVAIIPAVMFTMKARSGTVYIRVDENGIFVNRQLLTSWQTFRNASFGQKEKVMSIQDNFVLRVTYHVTGKGNFVREVPLTNTQNKSEEEVIAAIKYFYHKYQQGGQAGRK